MRRNHIEAAVAGATGLVVGACAVALLVKVRCGGAGGEESRRGYEQEAMARQYLEFHYTPTEKSFAQKLGSVREAYDFPVRIAERCIEHATGLERALDLGCASGCSSFVLSRRFDEVVGVDLSEALIRDAQRMKAHGRIEFRAVEQGYRGVPRSAVLPKGARAERCSFHVGDALKLDPSLGTFDCILAANLVCRVPDPEQLFASLRRALRPGGVLVLISPYSWWEGASRSSRWLGGHEGDDASEVLVKKRLSALGFELVDEGTEPFLLRDHVRRYQLGFSHRTVWRAKP